MHQSCLMHQSCFMFTESDPVCTSNLNDTDDSALFAGDVVTFKCALNYSGRWAPRMTWFDQNNNELEAVDLGGNQSVVHQINVTLPATSPTARFTCVTDFEDVTGTGEDEATNNIEYTHTYTSADITVHCKLLCFFASVKPGEARVIVPHPVMYS